MRLSFPFIACISTCALAAPIEQNTQDTIFIDRAISRANSALTNLANTITAYTRKPFDNTVIQQKAIDEDSNMVIDTLTQGAISIHNGPFVTSSEYSKVMLASNGLLSQLQTVSDKWVAAKNVIVGAGGRGNILETLKKQQVAALAFARSLVEKMPNGNTDPMAGWYTMQVSSTVSKAVKAYS